MAHPKRHVSVLNRRSVLKLSAAGAALSLGPVRALAQEPEKPAQLVVRAWGGNWKDSLEAAVSKPFAEETGIEILHDTTHQNEMKARVWTAIAQGRTPPVNVMWDIAEPAMESHLRGVTTDLSDLSNLSEMSDVATPGGVDGVPYINMYTYAFVLLYRPSAFEGGAPQSWKVLHEPRFKGRIGLGSPGNGEIAIFPIAGGGSAENIEEDIEKGWEFLRGVKENEPLVGKGEDISRWLQQGEVDLAVAILTDGVAMKKNGVDVDWTVPSEGSYYANDCLWVPKGQSEGETYWAKQFINFAMREKPHTEWTNRLGLPGTRKGLSVPQEFVGDPAYPTTPEDFARLFTIPPMKKVENWGDWHSTYTNILGL